MHLHALLENLPIRVFKSPPQISVPYVKVGSTEALNKWDLNSQHVTPTTTSFLKVPIKAFIFVIFILLLEGSNYSFK
jgi:hypothetical protein